jgi:REP element-mobilizing transposase RayT
MSHSFTSLLTHITFSTESRRPCISPGLKPELFAYMGGIIHETGGKPILINGPADHVHVVAVLSATVALSDFMRVLKTNSSRWVHDSHSDQAGFGWQTGYGAFSVSESNRKSVIDYVAGQEAHHKRMSFQEEFLALLKKHELKYDERFIWE